jgi:outer membrane lipoprotein SlyB
MRLGLLVAAAALVAAGCASRPSESDLRHGRIARVDAVSLQSDHQLGVGAVLGAVAGRALGQPFATGDSRAVAQVIGALGGSYAAGALEGDYPARRPGEHVTVTLNRGVAVGIAQLGTSGLRAGDCVRRRRGRDRARRAPRVGATPAPAPAQADAPATSFGDPRSASGWRTASRRRR